MSFSDKQYALISYLLEKLNFEEIDYTSVNDFTNNYFKHLRSTYNTFKNIGNCEGIEVDYNNKKENIPKDGLPNLKYSYNGIIYEIQKFSLINFLQLEIDIKSKKKYSIKDTINLDYISATDISNYTYCPVNYSISKTLYYKSLETALIGTKKHEESLINNITVKKQSSYDSGESLEEKLLEIDYDHNFTSLKEILCDFEIIYSGHSQNSKNRIFKSSKGKFIGQPDFILRNKKTNESIVIEEKYHFIPNQFYSRGNDSYFNDLENEINNKRDKNFFYENHLNQVSSYVYGISDYDIDYGILIYWKYEIRNNFQVVTKCFFRKVQKSEEAKYNLNEIYKKVLNFNRIKEIEFKIINRNPAKCASCVNNYLCGHKTGKYETLTIPYKTEYLDITNVEFPEILKNNNPIDNRTYIEKILENITNNKNEI